jgi:hypothetical protein
LVRAGGGAGRAGGRRAAGGGSGTGRRFRGRVGGCPTGGERLRDGGGGRLSSGESARDFGRQARAGVGYCGACACFLQKLCARVARGLVRIGGGGRPGEMGKGPDAVKVAKNERGGFGRRWRMRLGGLSGPRSRAAWVKSPILLLLRDGRATVVLASGKLAEVTAERIVYSAETAHLFERAVAHADTGDGTAAQPVSQSINLCNLIGPVQ